MKSQPSSTIELRRATRTPEDYANRKRYTEARRRNPTRELWGVDLQRLVGRFH